MSVPQVANRVLHTRDPSACFGTVAHRHVPFGHCPNPAACAFCLAHPISPNHDLAATLAGACDGDFDDVFPSDGAGPSSMAFTSRKW